MKNINLKTFLLSSAFILLFNCGGNKEEKNLPKGAKKEVEKIKKSVKGKLEELEKEVEKAKKINTPKILKLIAEYGKKTESETKKLEKKYKNEDAEAIEAIKTLIVNELALPLIQIIKEYSPEIKNKSEEELIEEAKKELFKDSPKKDDDE